MQRRIIPVLVAFFSLCALAGAEDMIKLSEHINSQHPLMIGDVIYEASVSTDDPSYGFYTVKYRYIGYDGFAISLRYEFQRDDPLVEGSASATHDIKTLVLPLDEWEETHLVLSEMPRIPQEIIAPSLTLVLSVDDREKALIRVKEFEKYRDFKDIQPETIKDLYSNLASETIR